MAPPVSALSRSNPPPGNPVSTPFLPIVMGVRPPSPRSLLMTQPAGELVTTGPTVSRQPMRQSIVYNYSYGADQMPLPQIHPGGADGQVWRSSFQQYVRRLSAWSPSLSFMHMAFPRNYGVSFRAPQIRTQRSGGAGPGTMGRRPFYNRVQVVPRPSRIVPTYPTTSAGPSGG